MRSDFYVYALLDPRKPGKYRYGKLKLDYEPFYVGKGCKNRHSHHFKTNPSKVYNRWKSGKIKRIKSETGTNPIVKLLKRDLVESEAFRLEAKAIRLIGRKGKGPLTNLTDGGEGTAGRIVSRMTRAKHTANNMKMWAGLSADDYVMRCASIAEGHSRRTPEERAALKARYSEIQKTLPEPVASKRSKRLSKSLRKYRSNMTEEQRRAESSVLSERQRSYWDSADETTRQARADAVRRGYASKDRSEIEAKNSKISDKIRQQHAAASEFDKRMRSFNVMVGVMLRNYTDSGMIDSADVELIKQRLRSSASKFYARDCNLTIKPVVLREKARAVILQHTCEAA